MVHNFFFFTLLNHTYKNKYLTAMYNSNYFIITITFSIQLSGETYNYKSYLLRSEFDYDVQRVGFLRLISELLFTTWF